MASTSRNGASVVAAESQTPQRPVKNIRAKPRVDYSGFSHRSHVVTQKLSCDSCHRFPSNNWKEARKVDTAFPDVTEFPEHASCLSCHRAQFFARERPAPIICANCHINVTPRDTTRFLFPSLGDVSVAEGKRHESVSEFKINFPHDKHVDLVGFNTPNSNAQRAFVSVSWQQKKEQTVEPKSCPVCHQTYQPQGATVDEYVTKPPKNLGDAFWLKKGTFKTIPNSHTACFSCHNQELGIAPSPSDCNACHKLDQTPPLSAADFDAILAEQMTIADRTMVRAWGRRISSGSFRHEGGDHPNMSCLACHHVESMSTLEPRTLKVQVKSCGGAEGCHITAKTDDGGILNYELDQKKANASFVCTKCHISYGKQVVPESHLAAIPKATKK
jgi:hypothetical protein